MTDDPNTQADFRALGYKEIKPGWWQHPDNQNDFRAVSPLRRIIAAQCQSVQKLLLFKNAKYGDSASNPLRLFSTATPLAAIAVRIDDKISRIRTAGGLERALSDAEQEDTVLDLIGYLILARCVHARRGDK